MDVVVEPGLARTRSSRCSRPTPEAGAVCPLIVLESDPGRINAAGQNVNVTGLGFNRWLEQAARARRHASRSRVTRPARRGVRDPPVDLFESIGGWDESGFLYHEDVELSWLLRLAGSDDLLRARPRASATTTT